MAGGLKADLGVLTEADGFRLRHTIDETSSISRIATLTGSATPESEKQSSVTAEALAAWHRGHLMTRITKRFRQAGTRRAEGPQTLLMPRSSVVPDMSGSLRKRGFLFVARPIAEPRPVPPPSHRSNTARIFAACGVLLLLMLATVILRKAEQQSRHELEMRFLSRTETASRFVRAYVDDLLAREKAVAEDKLAGTEVSPVNFETVVGALGLEAAVITDSRGALLEVYPSRPEMVGENIASRYPHLARALSSGTAMSPIVLSAAKQTPIIAFATQYRSASGVRVFSGAYEIARTPLTSFLKNLLPMRTTSVDLVDERGAVIASDRWLGADTTSLSTIDPPLAHALSVAETGRFGDSGQSRHYVSLKVADTPWRLVTAVDEAVLFSPVTTAWASRWWVVLTVLTSAMIVAAVLAVRLFEHREELSFLNAQLDRLSRVDALTDLPNRRHLEQELTRLGSAATRQDQSLSVLIIDIDHFKRINDEQGHPVGDVVLAGMARQMASVLRPEDQLGRWGGEEFVALLPNTSSAGAAGAAERIRAAAAAWTATLAGGIVVTGTVSIGCATTHGRSDESLVARADEALYRAKSNGRNRVAVSPDPILHAGTAWLASCI